MFIICCSLLFFVLSRHVYINGQSPGGGLTIDIQQYPPPCFNTLVVASEFSKAPVSGSLILYVLYYIMSSIQLLLQSIQMYGQILVCWYSVFRPIKLLFFFLAFSTNCIPQHHSSHYPFHQSTYCKKRYILSRTTPARVIDHMHDPP